jgi:hypothetical protein
MLNRVRITLDFFPKASGEVKGVSIVSDRELAGCASGASEETDFSLGV